MPTVDSRLEVLPLDDFLPPSPLHICILIMFTTESDSDNDSDIVYMGKSPTPATTRPSLERDVSEALPESVVDLTLDEDDDDDDADLDTRRAGKRQRRHSRLERVGAREGRTVMRLVGEPFADQHGLYDSYRLGMKLEGRDRRWRELHTGDKVIEVSIILSSRSARINIQLTFAG